jgi:hypothetical protein
VVSFKHLCVLFLYARALSWRGSVGTTNDIDKTGRESEKELSCFLRVSKLHCRENDSIKQNFLLLLTVFNFGVQRRVSESISMYKLDTVIYTVCVCVCVYTLYIYVMT